MAKGNDGNLLQHSIECALARKLSDDGVNGLHLVCTHAMDVSEPFEKRGDRPFLTIDAALAFALSRNPVGKADEPVIRAYHLLRASADSYPNSSELIGALVDRRKLRGWLVEKDLQKADNLTDRWHKTAVRVFRGSWRLAAQQGVLSCPKDLGRPWLLTMDPMSFCLGQAKDDGARGAHLYQGDLYRMFAVCEGYLRSRQPGVALVFCYSLRRSLSPWNYQRFQASMIQLRQDLGIGHLGFVETSSSNPHVCAALASDAVLLMEAKRAWTAVKDLA